MLNIFENNDNYLNKFIEENHDILLNTFKNNDNLSIDSDLHNHLYERMKKEYIYVYHATRVVDENDIYANGLIIPNSVKGYIPRNIMLCNIKSILGEDKKYSNLYNDIEKYDKDKKHGQFWFTITDNINYINIENTYYFFEKYGGEFLEDIFDINNMRDIYNSKIKNIGKPKIVKLKLKIDEINDKINISNLFVYIIRKKLNLINNDFFVTSYILEDVNKNRIVAIEDYKGDGLNV